MNEVPQNAGAAQGLADLLRHTDLAALARRHNIAPSEQVLAVRHRVDGSGYELIPLRWGLVPSWSKGRLPSRPLIHARAEMASERPAFRDAFRRRRCLVLADGFYVWKNAGGSRQPYHVRLQGGRPFAFAGLWEPCPAGMASAAETCAVLTVAANQLIRPFNARMPAILPAQDYEAWLDPTIQETQPVRKMLRPYPAEEMEAIRVSEHVNDPHHEDARCPRPIAKAAERTLF
jgi:putative SOS response-associated peptidase YedK